MIATGLTGFYDQNMHCGRLSAAQVLRRTDQQYKAVAPYFTIACDTPATTLPAHL